ncbi:MAG: HEAT repeat domain-containing protein [Anaerolineaceae bacterium]
MRTIFFEKSKPLVIFIVFLFVSMIACEETVDSAAGNPQKLGVILNNSNESSRNRGNAAKALAETGDPAAVEILLQSIDECDKTEAIWCHDVIMALGKLGDQRAAEPLKGLLDHEIYQFNVTNALEKLGDPNAIVLLIETVYQDTLNTSESHRSEENALKSYDDLVIKVNSMSTSSGSQAFKAVRDALPGLDVDPPEIEEMKSLDASCLKYRLGLSALLASGDPGVEATLISELDANRNCSWLLPHGLAKFYNYDPEKLLPFLKNEDIVTASQFATILVHVGSPGTEEHLISVLRECLNKMTVNDFFCANSIAAKFYFSKNVQLSDAAIQWASENNYDFSLVGPGYGEYEGPIWNDQNYAPYFK